MIGSFRRVELYSAKCQRKVWKINWNVSCASVLQYQPIAPRKYNMSTPVRRWNSTLEFDDQTDCSDRGTMRCRAGIYAGSSGAESQERHLSSAGDVLLDIGILLRRVMGELPQGCEIARMKAGR